MQPPALSGHNRERTTTEGAEIRGPGRRDGRLTLLHSCRFRSRCRNLLFRERSGSRSSQLCWHGGKSRGSSRRGHARLLLCNFGRGSRFRSRSRGCYYYRLLLCHNRRGLYDGSGRNSNLIRNRRQGSRGHCNRGRSEPLLLAKDRLGRRFWCGSCRRLETRNNSGVPIHLVRSDF